MNVLIHRISRQQFVVDADSFIAAAEVGVKHGQVLADIGVGRLKSVCGLEKPEAVVRLLPGTTGDCQQVQGVGDARVFLDESRARASALSKSPLWAAVSP